MEPMPANVPMPERRPTEAAPATPSLGASPPSPEGQVQSLLSPDDSRYNDPANVLFVDAILGGMMPWVQAGVDLAAGRINEAQFDQIRQEHQERINLLRQNNQTFVSAAEKAVPFLTGLGIGVAKPLSTMGNIKAGAGVAAAQGFGQGFSSGPTEEPSFSGKRVGEGLGTAAITAPLGAAGAAVPAGVAKVKGGLQKRADDKQTQRETKARQDEENAATEAAAAKKQATKDKAAKTRLNKKRDAEFKNEQADRFESYTKSPEDFADAWKDNRKTFMDNTDSVFGEAAGRGQTVGQISRLTKLPEIVVAERIKAAKPFAGGKGGNKLMAEVNDIISSKEAYNARLSGTDKPKPRAKKAK